MHNQYVEGCRHHCHRCEVFERVVWKIIVKRRVRRQRRVAKQERVTIAGGFGHGIGTDHRTRAAAIFHHHLHTEAFGQAG